jgi:hypothetical protein
MKADRRAKLVERALNLTWASMASHTPYTYLKHPDGKKFHKKCVREYAALIKIISELL